MALDSVTRLADYIELIVGKAGPNRDVVDRDFIYEVINSKAKDFAARTGILETSATILTVADQVEYELPSDKTLITKVTIDTLQVHKITFDQLERLRGDVT